MVFWWALSLHPSTFRVSHEEYPNRQGLVIGDKVNLSQKSYSIASQELEAPHKLTQEDLVSYHAIQTAGSITADDTVAGKSIVGAAGLRCCAGLICVQAIGAGDCHRSVQ